MSLMAKLTKAWRNDNDDIRDSIVENICGLVSSRAPIWDCNNRNSQLNSTIIKMGFNNATSSEKKSRAMVILAEIRDMIHAFEPRLSNVVLSLSESVTTNQLQFRISAIMHSDNGDEPIVFESFLDLNANHLDVRKTNLV